jgi:hypothetical protein
LFLSLSGNFFGAHCIFLKKHHKSLQEREIPLREKGKVRKGKGMWIEEKEQKEETN